MAGQNRIAGGFVPPLNNPRGLSGIRADDPGMTHLGGLVEGWKKYLVAIAAQSAFAVAPLFAADAAAQGDQPDLNARMNALQAELDALKAQQRTQREQAVAKEQQSTLDETLKDADRHSRFFDSSGVSAGFDSSSNRFFLKSDDGNFSLRPWFHLQIRGVANERNDFQGQAAEPKSETNTGFEIRRMRFGFDGNVFSPDFQYFFNWTTNRTSGNNNVTGTTVGKGTTIGTVSNSSGGVPILEEAWIKYHLPKTAFMLQLGQQHDPILHEEITSSRYRHSAEISLTADIFVNGDAFTQAAMVIFDPNLVKQDSPVRAEAGVNQGMRSANTSFLSFSNNGSYNAFDYGVAGRVEYKVMGRWKDYGQVAAVGVTEPLLVFGAGADYSERGHDGQTVGAVDGMYADQNGLMVSGEFLDRYTTHNFGYYTQSAVGASITDPKNPAYENKPTNEYSALIEAGYMFNNFVEPFGRFEYMKLAGTAVGTKPWVQAITGGVNLWFQGHRVKATAEVIYLPKGIPFDDTPNDVLAQPNGKSEVVGEFQLQLLL
jgi:hypothetical protein